jgi:3-oxoacyl-[acyl-carrier protein] reductase
MDVPHSKPSNEFLNKHVIVTGASSGIGQSVALYFLNCGAQVILAGQDVDTMRQMTENKFPNATIMQVDLTSDMHIYDFKTSIVERLQSIDIIVNCAGVQLDGDVEKTFPQDFDYTIDINLRAVFTLIKSLSPFLNTPSSIINMSCLYGSRPCTGLISYAISKSGLETLTKYAAAEFSPLGIRVNAITACPIETNNMRLIKVSDGEISLFKKKMQKCIPLGRMGRPDDIVRVVSFLASERSSKITGQIIRVDGGRGLTSSGYVHYRGMKNMNSRFEPDGVIMGEWFNSIKKEVIGDKIIFPINDQNDLKNFVDEKILESNFSTNLLDAHMNINTKYKIVEPNDQKLIQNYLIDKGKQANEIIKERIYDGPVINRESGIEKYYPGNN